MKKILTIEGMMCAHCAAHVDKALAAGGGASAVSVSRADKTARITLSAPVTDDLLLDTVAEAGYTATGIRDE